MKGAPKGASKRSARGLLRRHTVHRSPVTIIDKRHGDGLCEIVEVDPREVLPSGPNRSAKAEFEWGQHLCQRAPAPTNDDPGSEELMRRPNGHPQDHKKREKLTKKAR